MILQFLMQVANFLPVLLAGCVIGYIAAMLLGDDRQLVRYTIFGAIGAVTGPIIVFAALGYERTMFGLFSMTGVTAAMGFALLTIFLYAQLTEILE
jgi:uncharacterized membrane protein YeaQ/YmgE (transglycosylase-associated protein family)